MLQLSIPFWGDVTLFFVAAAVIGLTGTKMAGLADRLADRSGLGEAITGTVFLGLITALPGLTASVYAALLGRPVLAISNAMGGIAFQTTVLAVADLTYRKANLEHAAASVENIMQVSMLILLLTLVSVGLAGPSVTLGHVHPTTLLLILGAAMAFTLVAKVREKPMWKPRQTDQTVEDEPAVGSSRENLGRLAAGLLVMAIATLVAGALVAESAGNIVSESSIPEAVVGGLFMAAATSLPELVTCVAAVRRGALTLAVSDIVGGNFFDVLFVAAADIVYLQGSLLHGTGVGMREVFITSFTILLNVVLLVGLMYRQKHGPGNIGFESVLMLVIYIGGFLTLSLAM